MCPAVYECRRRRQDVQRGKENYGIDRPKAKERCWTPGLPVEISVVERGEIAQKRQGIGQFVVFSEIGVRDVW